MPLMLIYSYSIRTYLILLVPSLVFNNLTVMCAAILEPYSFVCDKLFVLYCPTCHLCLCVYSPYSVLIPNILSIVKNSVICGNNALKIDTNDEDADKFST